MILALAKTRPLLVTLMLARCLISIILDLEQVFIILHGGTTTSCESSKPTLVVISTNYSEIITLYEASRESYGFTE